jgi:hypothetical protein
MRKQIANGRGAVLLRLLPGNCRRQDWSLDERSRRVGRQGVAQAREILRRSALDRRSKAS